MKRLGEVSPDGVIRMRDGSQFRGALPIELMAAATQPQEALGYLALLRRFVAQLEPEPGRAATLARADRAGAAARSASASCSTAAPTRERELRRWRAAPSAGRLSRLHSRRPRSPELRWTWRRGRAARPTSPERPSRAGCPDRTRCRASASSRAASTGALRRRAGRADACAPAARGVARDERSADGLLARHGGLSGPRAQRPARADARAGHRQDQGGDAWSPRSRSGGASRAGALREGDAVRGPEDVFRHFQARLRRREPGALLRAAAGRPTPRARRGGGLARHADGESRPSARGVPARAARPAPRR